MNTEEAKIAGSQHPPAVKVGAGVSVWCKELQRLESKEEGGSE
jgi:hypothetical protein